MLIKKEIKIPKDAWEEIKESIEKRTAIINTIISLAEKAEAINEGMWIKIKIACPEYSKLKEENSKIVNMSHYNDKKHILTFYIDKD